MAIESGSVKRDEETTSVLASLQVEMIRIYGVRENTADCAK
jgi:hypothetical protein